MNRVQSLRGLLPPTQVVYYRKPIHIERGSMQWLYDTDGRKYLDMFGGIVTVSVGHCHPTVNAALEEQSKKLWHTTSIYLTTPMLEYAEALTAKLPDPLKVVFFVNSGSEANDLAIKLARLHTGRFDMLSLRNGYHGMTQSVIGATNIASWKHPLPSGFGILKAMLPDPLNGPWGGRNCRDCEIPAKRECDCGNGPCKAGNKYLKEFSDCLGADFPAATGPAAFLAESIQGIGGTVQYPKNFLPQAFDAVKARGGLCIADEVQTGFGRLGTHFWGFEANGVLPDMITMAKGIGNGFPIGAVVTTVEIAKALGQGLYFNTYGGNPLAAAVGKAVLKVIEEEKLQENAHIVGEYFLKQLAAIDSPLIADVRGKGLMIGVEMVDESGAPMPSTRMCDIFEYTKDKGVLVGKGGPKGNVFRIKPPMCITKADVDQCVSVIAEAIKACK
uniref:Alanine--glyoxylate aminotransferase 2, mitochondrial n=1 Tax=Panagrellus redivivus TaxID=6233 RepID=A0A7E4V024_PANRE